MILNLVKNNIYKKFCKILFYYVYNKQYRFLKIFFFVFYSFFRINIYLILLIILLLPTIILATNSPTINPTPDQYFDTLTSFNLSNTQYCAINDNDKRFFASDYSEQTKSIYIIAASGSLFVFNTTTETCTDAGISISQQDLSYGTSMECINETCYRNS